jgi:hypothetical protein
MCLGIQPHHHAVGAGQAGAGFQRFFETTIPFEPLPSPTKAIHLL